MDDVLRRYVIFVPDHAQYRPAANVAQQEPRRIVLRIAADLADLQAPFAEGRRNIGRRRGLANAAFTIKGNFFHSYHSSLCVIILDNIKY